MNDDIITDLKQFITATVSQQTTDLGNDLRREISGVKDEISGIKTDIVGIRTDIQRLDDKLSTKIDDLTAFVTETIGANNDSTDQQLKNHGQRIARLETQPVSA